MIKTWISNLVQTTRFWNKIQQSKDWEINNLKVFESKKEKGLNRPKTAKLTETLSFINNYII